MDEAEFDRFYESSYDRLVGQLYAMCGNRAEAQDCVQEAFVRGWDHRRQLGAAHNPEAWIRTVAHRLLVSRWRRTRRHTAMTVEPTAPTQITPDAVALQRAMAAIPADQSRAIVLHDLVGLSVAEIAAESGVADGTVKSWLSRGRRTLANALSEGGVRHV